MSLKSINPTKTKSWFKLRDHFQEIKDTRMDDFFISDKLYLPTLSNISLSAAISLSSNQFFKFIFKNR